MGRYDESPENLAEGEEGEGEQSDEVDSPEEGFLQGYAEEEEVNECAECGGAVAEEQKVTKDIEGESYCFCSKHCKDEFEESFG